jgi:hypothetical protein
MSPLFFSRGYNRRTVVRRRTGEIVDVIRAPSSVAQDCLTTDLRGTIHGTIRHGQVAADQ